MASFSEQNHYITVCVCTYKRQQLLGGLLDKLTEQDTFNLFDYSVVVVDNDVCRSAEDIVSKKQATYPVELHYFVEPERNISLARNMCVLNAKGDLIAFIDDDEFPDNYWLVKLFKAMDDYQADGVFGHINRYFANEVPEWVISAGVFPNVVRTTGARVPWNEAYTSNVLLKKGVFFDKSGMFNKDFGLTGGGDVEFFKVKSEKGYRFIGCNEALVFEPVPQQRCNRTYLLKKALLEGCVYMKIISVKERFHRVLKSSMALLVYSCVVPICFMMGKNCYMKYLIKACHHISMLLAVCGVMLVKDRSCLGV